MKKFLFILTFIFTTATIAVAQERGEKLEALRIAYITKQLPLTAEEAKSFWPVYDAYEGEMRRLIRDCHQKNCSQIELDEKILNLRKKYKSDFLKVISEAKFDRLIKAESTLKDMIMKELQRRKEGGGPGGRRGNRPI